MFRSLHPAARLTVAAFATIFSTGAASAQLIVGRGTDADIVYHIDVNTTAATPLFNLTDNGITFGGGVLGLDVDDAGRTIYFFTGTTTGDPDTMILYRAHYDDRDIDNPTLLRARKVVDLSFAGEFPQLSGLAWDGVNNKLYTSYEFGLTAVPEGIFEINLNTGALTAVMDLDFDANIALSGLAFNPANGLLYATNNDTGDLFLNSINLTLPPASARTVIATAPITANDEGLAIGNDRAYILPANGAAAIKVYNLSTNAFEADLTLTPWTGADNASGAGWGPNALIVPAGTNLGVDIASAQNTAQEFEQGATLSYTVRLTNFGPSNATNLTYTISLGGTAAGTISNIGSTSGNAVESPTGTITASFTDFFVSQVETITFDVTTTLAGNLSVTVNLPPGANADPYVGNNTDVINHVIRVFPAVETVFTSLGTSPKSDVPGLPGAKFDPSTSASTERFRKPSRSPDGARLALWADTDQVDTQDNVFMVRNNLGNWTVGAREGVTAISNGGDLLGSMILQPLISINNAGQFCFTNDSNASTTTDEVTVVFDGSVFTAVAREDSLIPAFSAQSYRYDADMDSPNINGTGQAAFRVTDMVNAPATEDVVLLGLNGTSVFAQEGVTIPANQAGGGTAAFEVFDADDFWTDCGGVQWMVQGDLVGTTGDDVVVVNGSVVLQEGQPITGLTGNAGATVGAFVQMMSNGDWFVRGSSSASEDFVVKGNGGSYTLLAKEGDEIYPGAGEHWVTFVGFAGNNQGDYVLAGTTDEINTNRNTVVVVNGTDLVLRENDPLDLNDNGLFDDDAYLNSFLSDTFVLTDAGELIASANSRPFTGSTFNAKALISLMVPVSPAPSGADINVQKTVSDDFLESVGQQTVFSIRVCNSGPQDATNVVLSDALPAGLDFISATNGAVETAPGSNIVTATEATIAACDCADYEITVAGTAEGVWENTASATATQADPNGDNNSSSATVTVENQADVSVTKVDDGGAPVGQNFTYTITITNNGPATATNVQMTDTLDGLTTFVSATNGAVQGPAGVVTRTFASIAPSASEVVQITVQGNSQALVTNNVSVTAVEVDLNTANNTASVDTIVGDVADLAVTLTDPGLQNVGDNFAYTLTVANGGPATATGVQVSATVPAGLNVVSLTNGAIENPPASGNIQATFASIASQASEQIVITVNAAAAGTFNVSASATANEIDPDDLNNNAFVTTRTGDFLQILPIYTRIAGHPTATVPGFLNEADQPAAAEFDSMLNINVSADGSRWTVDASSDYVNGNIDSVMMLGSGFTGTVFAQEGKQAADAPAGQLYVFFDDDVGFNSNNDFSWGAITTTLDITYTNIAGVNTNVARSGDPVFGLLDANGDEVINNSMVSEHLLDDGRVGFNASNIGGSNSDPAMVYWDNQFGINATPFQNGATIDGSLVTGFAVARVFYTTPDGLHTLIRATISTGNMVAFDGVGVIRTGDTFGSVTIDAVFDIQLANSGDWIARGDQPGDDDWVIRNGVLIAATGTSIAGGAETWGNSIGTARVNDVGDYLIGGNTSEPDTNFDNVLALNGERVIVREGDPVDLNGNGVFDDGVFINTFSANNAYLANDGRVHFLATLRNAEGTNLQTAFLVVNTADQQACATLFGDINGDSITDGTDVQGFTDCALTLGAPTGACLCADADSSGVIDEDDIDAFVNLLIAP